MSFSPVSVTRPGSSSRKREALNISIEDFKSGMEKFARMFTGNYGVQLVFRGTSAYTDGKRIVVPELSLLSRPNMTDKEIDEAIEFLMCTRGFVYHEGAHIIFSGDIKTTVKAAVKVSPKFKLLWNVLEDLRIERAISDMYPGAREALVFMNDWLMNRIATTSKDSIAKGGKISPFAQVCYAIGLIGTLAGTGEEHEMWSLLNEQTRDYVQSIRTMVARARNASSPKISYKIALEIWNHLKAEEERRKEEKRKQSEEKKSQTKERSDGEKKHKCNKSSKEEGDEDDSGSAHSDEDDGVDEPDEDDDNGDHQSDDSDESDNDSDDGDVGDTEDAGDHDAEDAGSGSASPLEEDEQLVGDEGDASDKAQEKEETIRQKMQEEVKNLLATGEKRYLVYTTENDVIGPPPKPSSDNEMQLYRQAVRKLDDETQFAYGPVKRRLENVLKTRTRSYYVHGLEDGELDPAALHKLAAAVHGGPQMKAQAQSVFREKCSVKSLKSTDVEILIDVSGSMGCAGKDVSTWNCNTCKTEHEYLVIPPSIDYSHYVPGILAGSIPRLHDHECPSCFVQGSHTLVKVPEWEQKVSLARKCALVFAHALDSVHVPFDMFTYTTGSMSLPSQVLSEIASRSQDEYSEVRKLYSRFGGLRIMDMKRFDEKWPDVKWRLAHMQASQCNYDGEALRLGAQRLMSRRSSRKVMFVLCDGIPGPCSSESHAEHERFLSDVIKEIRTSTPIEVIGIGIGAPEAERFYKPGYVNVMNASRLPTICIQQLERILLQ